MTLIDRARGILRDLANGGWAELLAHHGLDIGAGDLLGELRKGLTSIDRGVPGFEDFAAEGERGIEPGSPSHSLLYHALASPNVVALPDGRPLTKFPSLRDLDMIENLVFGIEIPSITDVRARVQNSRLSLVVFSCDYRPATATSHRRHADLMFSRTGVARVGTAAEEYVGRLRGFVPFVDGATKGVRVLPARYVVYLAVQRSGSERDAIPMRMRPGDGGLKFWVPVHKLFEGDECLSGLDGPIDLTFVAKHVSEKLRRIHLSLRRRGIPTGVDDADLDQPPFLIRQGIAELGDTGIYPKGVLVPVPHAALVEKAIHGGFPAGFPVDEKLESFSSSIRLAPDRSAPEFVHARLEILGDGSTNDLNQFEDVAALVDRGGYRAQHFLDHTADGSVAVICERLAEHPEIGGIRAAYSLVSAPDFFPLVDQRELTEWTEQLGRAGTGLSREDIWKVPPDPLSDDRLAPNLQFPDFQFDAAEKGVTAVVGLAGRVSGQQAPSTSPDPMRQSHLPDDAAGVFAPGWDVSRTAHPTTGIDHLAAFGLGSPFPEDAKLCAALSAFWPAVAPDISRSIQPIGSSGVQRTVSPLTDDEIGVGGVGLPWDGIEPLRVLESNGQELLEYAAFDQTDYVQQSLDNNLTVSLIGRLTARQYQDRVVAISRFYKGLQRASETAHGENLSLIYSFREVGIGDGELIEAQAQGGLPLVAPVFRVLASSMQGLRFQAVGGSRVRIPVREKVEVFVSAGTLSILLRTSGANWKRVSTL